MPQNRVLKVFSAVVLGACLIVFVTPDSARGDFASDGTTTDIDQRLYALCPNADCYNLTMLGTYLPGDQDTDNLAGFETLEDLLFDWNRASKTTLLGDLGNGAFTDPGSYASVRAGWDEKPAGGYVEAAHIPSPSAIWLMGSISTTLLLRKPVRGR